MTTQQLGLCVGAALAAIAGRTILRESRRIDFRDRSVVITGGSRGLGLLVARQLAAEGANLTIAARDRDELERAARELREQGAEVATVECDIGAADAARQLVEEVVDRTGRIDVLVNNAGRISVGPFEHMKVEDFREAMAIHFWGPLHAMSAAIPFMRAQRFGRIVNVSSMGGRIGVPHLTAYSASKFALTGLSDALRAEVAKDGIRVTTVLPGLMRTGSPFNAWFKGRHRDEFTWFAIADSLPLATIDANRAAARLIEACRYGDAEATIGWPVRLAIAAQALAPESVALASELINRFVLPAPTSPSGDKVRSGWDSFSAWAPSKLTRSAEQAALRNNEIPF